MLDPVDRVGKRQQGEIIVQDDPVVALDELRALISRHGGREPCSPHLPNLALVTERAPTPPCQLVAEPMFSLVAQGAKRVDVGSLSLAYRAGQFLVIPVELPVNAQVVEATASAPCLGFGLALRPAAIASLLLDASDPPAPRQASSAVVVGKLAADLVDSVVRLLRLFERPGDLPILGAALEREVLWRLINGPLGGLVCQIGLADSRLSQVGRAIRWLREHFAEAVRIEELAELAGMSATSLHRHFRSVTTMTPIQYQKQLRLQAARARLLATREDVSEVGFAVGYGSASQFSRDYRRMFGSPPGRDGAALRDRRTALPRRK